jgi:hypothetical protein
MGDVGEPDQELDAGEALIPGSLAASLYFPITCDWRPRAGIKEPLGISPFNSSNYFSRNRDFGLPQPHAEAVNWF